MSNTIEESIYNIIPKEYKPEPKSPLYRSKYPHTIPPTASTFCHHTTSKPGISNLSGQFQLGLQAHTEMGSKTTMGYLKNDRRPSPQHFQKKHTGTMGSNTLPNVRKFSYDCKHTKASVPKASQRPVFGQKTNKNFIVSNAVENILSSARKIPERTNYLQKKDYGQVPQYLHKIKKNIEQQYKMIQRLHNQNQQKKQLLSPQEIEEIRNGLKMKWNEINHQYQQLTHIRLFDTTGLKRRKQSYERQLSEIQQDIKKLNKAYIFIE